MVVSWLMVWSRISCAAKRVARGAVKGLVICVGCTAVLCCRGHEGSNSQAGLTGGDHVINPGLLGVLTGTAIYFAAKHVGPALDNAVITGLTSPNISQDKKNVMRRLNYGYSALKFGLILAVGKGACFCMDQSKKEADRVGLACTAGVIIAPLAASLCKTAFK